VKRPPKPPISDEIQSRFLEFQRELDVRHDRYERLVKCSRDITIESKRTIFLLHRAVGAWSSPTDAEAMVEEGHNRLASIRADQWTRVGQELQGEDAYLYIRAYSPGLQEYIEAVTFANYLRNGTLLSWTDIRKSLSNLPSKDSDTPDSSSAIEVPLIDYLSGVADLTGELMRAAINSIAAGDQRRPQQICEFLTRLYGGFSLFPASVSSSKDWSMKMRTFRQSLSKVENVCYVLKLRGTEVPDYMLAEVVTAEGSYPVADNLPVDTHLDGYGDY